VGVVEISTGVERRRHWRPEDKLRILAELHEPGAKFVKVARRNEVNRGLLWQWRDAERRGTLVADKATFMPVRVIPELPAPASPSGPAGSSSSAQPKLELDDRIEIVLPDGTALRVGPWPVRCGVRGPAIPTPAAPAPLVRSPLQPCPSHPPTVTIRIVGTSRSGH
jgi:transposase